MIIKPGSINTKDFHAFLLGSVAPRPICFASTIDENGNANLSPFSFFNVFGSKPPICVFSPARRVRDNTIKHTLENVEASQEVVIAMVNYSMVQQMSLASCEYPKGVDEFVKAGFTKGESEIIRPYLVKEAPVNLECKVIEVYKTGSEGGAGNLIICEVVNMHIKEEVLGADGMIDPHKIDLVARMGKDFYCRASGDAVFEVPKPNLNLGIGLDQLPESIKKSSVLTGNDLGMLANCSVIPEFDNTYDHLMTEVSSESFNEMNVQEKFHLLAQKYLQSNKLDEAWQILLRSL